MVINDKILIKTFNEYFKKSLPGFLGINVHDNIAKNIDFNFIFKLDIYGHIVYFNIGAVKNYTFLNDNVNEKYLTWIHNIEILVNSMIKNKGNILNSENDTLFLTLQFINRYLYESTPIHDCDFLHVNEIIKNLKSVSKNDLEAISLLNQLNIIEMYQEFSNEKETNDKDNEYEF